MTGLPFQMKFYCTVIEYLVALLQTGLAYHTCHSIWACGCSVRPWRGDALVRDVFCTIAEHVKAGFQFCSRRMHGISEQLQMMKSVAAAA